MANEQHNVKSTPHFQT